MNPAPIYPYTNTPAAIDLTTLQAVKDYLATDQAAIVDPTAANADDLKIQAIITGLSQYWLTQTGRNTLNSIESYGPEFYDGPGGAILFLENWPLQSVSALSIDNVNVPQSTAVAVPGWVVQGNNPLQRKSIALRAGGAGGLVTTVGYPVRFVYRFNMGIQNVSVTYTAGYDGIPNDVFEAVTWQAAQAYKRREQINLESMNMGGGAGSANYVKWDWTPEVRGTLNSYKKIVISGT